MLNFVVFNKLHHTLFHSTFVLRIITLDRMSPFPFLAHLKASILFQMKRKLWNFSHQFFTKSRQGSTIFNNYVSILPRNKYNVADTKKERKVLSVCVLPVSKVVLAQIGTTNQHTVVKNIKFAMLQSYKKNKKKTLFFLLLRRLPNYTILYYRVSQQVPDESPKLVGISSKFLTNRFIEFVW